MSRFKKWNEELWDGKLLLCFLIVMATALAAGFASVKRVTVIADGKTQEIKTAAVRVDRILHEAGIHLDDKDEYRLSTPDVVDRTEIRVFRAVLVNVEADGRTRQIKTAKQTVGELLMDLGYSQDVYQTVPGANTPIVKDLHIHLRKHSEIAEEARRQAELEQARQVHDFVETSRGRVRYTDVLWMEASAYLPTDGGGDCITASGLPARHGVVAVDPEVIPLGTRLFIPGYGFAIAADTGGMIEGHMIDLCMEDYDSCMEFGRRDIDVYVLES